MDNPNNILITKEIVENILNYYGNIGDNGLPLEIGNLEYYQQAFVHESYFQSVQNTLKNSVGDTVVFPYIPKESSERLEYLGDHILKAVMGRYLYTRFDTEREGFLTKLKIKIEKCSMLHKIGVTLGFKKYLLLSLQVENQTILDIDRGRNTPSYYEDAFEAFVGSILLDFGERGYVYADRFVTRIIENIIDFAELVSKNDNFKDSLQRYFQSIKWNTPVYSGLCDSGPLYRKVFTRMLTITAAQLEQLEPNVKLVIQRYSTSVTLHYKKTDSIVYTKLFELVTSGHVVLGVGFGKKVIVAEQECAKVCMGNLKLDDNF
ncbi:hypothetical protein EB118_03515 [bacterium]|nr:hypothetical protein [bacterium]NDC94048.1 hypothetical protein [bacterium]NDD82734.1 hypothetical protein [bacterium]NDG29154.1 hypothetical protein [bacterium]